MIAEAAADLLRAVEDTFAAASIALPERRFIHAGQVADDCSQLTVAYVQTALDPADFNEVTLVRHEYEVRITREVPVAQDEGEPPSTEALERASAAIMADARALYRALASTLRQPGYLDACGQIRVGPIAVLGPEGGISGVACFVGVSV